jgi:hypothetical protein
MIVALSIVNREYDLMHGYLSEHHSFGETDERAGDYAEDLAARMLATTLGIEFDSELDWDEREQIFKVSGKIVRTTNITQSAVGHKDCLWTTVFTAAVFINDDNPPVEVEKPGAVKASLQEEVLRQTLEGQLKDSEAGQLAYMGKGAVLPVIEPARLPQPTKKNLFSRLWFFSLLSFFSFHLLYRLPPT